MNSSKKILPAAVTVWLIRGRRAIRIRWHASVTGWLIDGVSVRHRDMSHVELDMQIQITFYTQAHTCMHMPFAQV